MTTNKTWVTLFGGLTLTVLAGCSGAAADVGHSSQPVEGASHADGHHRHGKGRHHDPAAFVQRFDTNGDGMLEVKELPEEKQKRLADADTNRDGKLSIDELKAHREAHKGEMLKKADKNGNGSLEADEVGEQAWAHLRLADADNNGSVTHEELKKAHADGKLSGHGDPKAFFKHFDKNGNGRVELSELPERKQKRFEGADTNHDGALDEAEFTAARGAHGFHGHRFAKLDRNGDGALNKEEAGDDFWSRISAADANNDGKVTKDEWKQGRASGKGAK